jgi:hypothetical protein
MCKALGSISSTRKGEGAGKQEVSFMVYTKILQSYCQKGKILKFSKPSY